MIERDEEADELAERLQEKLQLDHDLMVINFTESATEEHRVLSVAFLYDGTVTLVSIGVRGTGPAVDVSTFNDYLEEMALGIMTEDGITIAGNVSIQPIRSS